MTRTWTGQHSIWSWYGGQALQIRHPTKAQFELAERALDAVPCDRNRLLYARVDIVPAPATVSSLQITAVVASRAHRVAVHDPDVARHPWLVSATAFCLRAIEALGPSPHALELIFALQLVDLIHNSQPEARRLLNRLGKLIPTSGVMHVEGNGVIPKNRYSNFQVLERK